MLKIWLVIRIILHSVFSAPAGDRPLLQEHRRGTETFLRLWAGFSCRCDDIQSRLTLAELEASGDQSRLRVVCGNIFWSSDISLGRNGSSWRSCVFFSPLNHKNFYFIYVKLHICQMTGCHAAQVRAESLFYWVSSSSFLRKFKLDFFTSWRVYCSFRLICILIWELFAFLLLTLNK